MWLGARWQGISQGILKCHGLGIPWPCMTNYTGYRAIALTLLISNIHYQGHWSWPWLVHTLWGHGHQPWPWLVHAIKVMVNILDHGQYKQQGSWSKILNMLTMVKFLSCSASKYCRCVLIPKVLFLFFTTFHYFTEGTIN